MLKKVGSSGRHQLLRPLCYGKLPLSADFLKSWGGEASGRFQRWMNALDQNGGSRARLPRPMRILMIPDGVEEVIVATVWGSNDNRSRSFPFSLYFEATRDFLGASLSYPVQGCVRLWRCLESKKQKLEASGSSGEFYQELRSPELCVSLTGDAEHSAGFEKELGSISIKALASAIFREDPVEGWVRLLWRVSQALGAGHRAALSARTIALRIPLGRGIAPEVQIEAWLKSIRERAGNFALIPSVIHPLETEERPSSFSILFRPLRESDIRLIQGETGSADVLDLTVPDRKVDVAGFLEFREMVLDRWGKPEADLRHLLPQVHEPLKGSE